MSVNSDYIENTEKNGHIGRGILGALLFALIGGILWVILFKADIFTGICGMACVVSSIAGYRLFSGKAGLKDVFIAIAASVLVMAAVNYLCLAIEVHNAFNEWYAEGDYDHALSFGDALLYAYQFFADPDVSKTVLADFGWGVLFCVIGAFTFIADGIKQYRLQKDY